MSGGNAGNQLTAAARLGLAAALVTKMGDDGVADQMLAELQEAGISTEYVLREDNHPSPFSYLLVDREGVRQSLTWQCMVAYALTVSKITDLCDCPMICVSLRNVVMAILGRQDRCSIILLELALVHVQHVRA